MSSLESKLKSTKPITDPHMRAFLNVMVTGAWLEARMNTILKPHGLTEPQYNVLRILRGQNGQAMNLYEIVDRMVHPTSNVSRIIDKLLEKGFVLREECPSNRRRVNISVTKKGLHILDDLDPVFEGNLNEIKLKLNADQAYALSEALEVLRD